MVEWTLLSTYAPVSVQFRYVFHALYVPRRHQPFPPPSYPCTFFHRRYHELVVWLTGNELALLTGSEIIPAHCFLEFGKYCAHSLSGP